MAGCGYRQVKGNEFVRSVFSGQRQPSQWIKVVTSELFGHSRELKPPATFTTADVWPRMPPERCSEQSVPLN